MAGKGGGAWKVAYADFVTAMMAFFLVMWLTAQDQQIKKAVSYYFMDPLGASRKPSRGGGVVNETSTGTVPNSSSVGGGQGRMPHSSPNNEPSPITKVVSDWLHADKAANAYWKSQSVMCRDLAAGSAEVAKKARSLDEVAAEALAKQLKAEFSREVATKMTGIYQDLLFATFAEVNWTELAEDLLFAR